MNRVRPSAPPNRSCSVKTAKVAYQLATKLGVDAPIMRVMYAAIHEGMPMREAVTALLARPVGIERD